LGHKHMLSSEGHDCLRLGNLTTTAARTKAVDDAAPPHQRLAPQKLGWLTGTLSLQLLEK